MNEEYLKRVLTRLNERRAKYNLLVAKEKLIYDTEREVKRLKEELHELDNRISVLTPNN